MPVTGIAGSATFKKIGTVSGPLQFNAPVWDAEKNEIVYLRAGPGSSVQPVVDVEVSVSAIRRPGHR